MHHAANRQVDLGRVAETGGNRPETRAYGARLATDFQALDARIVATAEPLGVDQARLERIYAGENTAALSREAEDLTRLAGEHGDAFDRQFWVIVAHDQLAAADMLAPVADADSRLDPIVVDLGRALEGSSRLALVAARPVAGPAPVSAPAPVVPAPDVPRRRSRRPVRFHRRCRRRADVDGHAPGVAASAATSASGVGDAATDGSRPAARAASAVVGPITATRTCARGAVPPAREERAQRGRARERRRVECGQRRQVGDRDRLRDRDDVDDEPARFQLLAQVLAAADRLREEDARAGGHARERADETFLPLLVVRGHDGRASGPPRRGRAPSQGPRPRSAPPRARTRRRSRAPARRRAAPPTGW